MDLMLLRLFQRQVEFQCRAVHLAGVQVGQELAQGSTDQTQLWAGVQSLLTAAANISKACWGQSGKYEAEREPLRTSLGVTDASPLRGVWMRNRFDHYDEALDDWWAQSTSHNHIDFGIFPLNAIRGFAEIEMFRVLDPQTMDIVFWGKRLNLLDVLLESQRILRIASTEAAKSHSANQLAGGT
jgi:hypothetical protein